jgi:fatty acid desaturase
MASVYQINKGVSKPIVFKGLKAQYIAYLAVGLVLLLICFALLYILGTSPFILLPFILLMGTVLFTATFRLSHRFGEHGLMKFLAKNGLPRSLKFRSRRIFTTLKYHHHGRS